MKGRSRFDTANVILERKYLAKKNLGSDKEGSIGYDMEGSMNLL